MAVDTKQQEIKVQYVDPNTLRPHPDAETIPMSKEDEQALRSCIAKDGFIKTPLHTTPDGRILDGIHRWRFAIELGITSIPIIVFHFEHPEEESIHALDSNLDRRHINEGQKAILKLRRESFQKTLEDRRGEARERQKQAAIETNKKRWGEKSESSTSDRLLPQGSKRSENDYEKIIAAPIEEIGGVKYASIGDGHLVHHPELNNKSLPGETMDHIAKLEGVSARTLYRAKVVAQDNERTQAVLNGDVSLTKAYQDIKADEKVQKVKKLQEAQYPLTDLEIMQKLSIPVQPYDVWSFPVCDDRFGRDYPGRIPGQLVAHCLYFWTEQGDLVVDPMAGSGTTIDVCKVLNRRVLAYDAHPSRNDITLHNIASQDWPAGTAEAKLIFWDPPYFKKVDGGYGDQSISRLDRTAYLKLFMDRARSIPSGFHGRLAFLMSDYTEEADADESIWFTDYANIFTGCGWRIERYIQTPLTSQSVHPDIANKFRISKRLARLGRVLMVVNR